LYNNIPHGIIPNLRSIIFEHGLIVICALYYLHWSDYYLWFILVDTITLLIIPFIYHNLHSVTLYSRYLHLFGNCYSLINILYNNYYKHIFINEYILFINLISMIRTLIMIRICNKEIKTISDIRKQKSKIRY